MSQRANGIAADQDELDRPRLRLLELVRDESVPDQVKLEALARELVALRILDGNHAARIEAVAEATVRIEATLAMHTDSLAATQLYAMRAEATARRIEALRVHPPRWNGAVKAVFGLVATVSLVLAGGFAQNPTPYIEALERWFR